MKFVRFEKTGHQTKTFGIFTTNILGNRS